MQDNILLSNLFTQSVNLHRKEINAPPLPDKHILSEQGQTAGDQTVGGGATPLPKQTPPPEPPRPPQPHGLEPRNTSYQSLADGLLGALVSRLSDPTAAAKEIYSQASEVIPDYQQAASCATCQAASFDHNFNQLTCQRYKQLTLSSYICGDHQAYTEPEAEQTLSEPKTEPLVEETAPQQAAPAAATTPQEVAPEQPKQELSESSSGSSTPEVVPADKELFDAATKQAVDLADLDATDREVYAVVIYKKAYEQKYGSAEGMFVVSGQLDESFKDTLQQFSKWKTSKQA